MGIIPSFLKPGEKDSDDSRLEFVKSYITFDSAVKAELWCFPQLYRNAIYIAIFSKACQFASVSQNQKNAYTFYGPTCYILQDWEVI